MARLARDEERHWLQDLIFQLDDRVFFQHDMPVGVPLGIHFHRVAAVLPVRQILVLPEMHDATQFPNMRDEEAVGLAQIFALQRECEPLIGFEKFRDLIRFDCV